MKRKNLAQFKEEILTMYSEGLSMRAIAEHYDVAYSSIRRILNKEGVTRKPKTIEEYLPDMYEDYLNGMNFSEIGRKYNKSHATVSNHLMRRYNAKPLKRGRQPVLEKYKDIWALEYKKGKSLSELAQEYDVSVEAVRKNIFKSAEGDTRSYPESLKKYEVNSKYFDKLTSEKAFQLGVMIAKFRKYSEPNTKTPKLRMTIKKQEENSLYLKFLFEGWIDEIPTIHKGEKSESFIEIRNEELYQVLLENGFESETVLGKYYHNEMMRGYLSIMRMKADASGSVYISLFRGKKQPVLDWLEQNNIKHKFHPERESRPAYISIRKDSQKEFKEMISIN